MLNVDLGCQCPECLEEEPRHRAPAHHGDDCICRHCWTGEDAAESLANGGNGLKPLVMPSVSLETRPYRSVEDFYDADDRRRRSPEADYGIFWTEKDRTLRHRVAFVQYTGELYALTQGYVAHLDHTLRVLGLFPPDTPDGREVWYSGLDAVLKGWPAHCGPRGGLSWIASRLRCGRSTCPNGCCVVWPEASPHAASSCRKEA